MLCFIFLRVALFQQLEDKAKLYTRTTGCISRYLLHLKAERDPSSCSTWEDPGSASVLQVEAIMTSNQTDGHSRQDSKALIRHARYGSRHLILADPLGEAGDKLCFQPNTEKE